MRMKGLNIKPLFLCSLFIGALSFQFLAQDGVLMLNMEKTMQLAGANNLTVEQYRLKLEIAKADLADQKGWWVPDLYGGITVHKLVGTAMNADGLFFTDVNRGSLWMGPGVEASWNASDIIFNTPIAETQILAGEKDVEATKNKLVLWAVETYLDLMVNKYKYAAYRKLYTQAFDLSEQIRFRSEGGIGYESDFLLSKSKLVMIELETEKLKMEEAQLLATLIKLLNVQFVENIVITDSVLVPVELINPEEIPQITEELILKRPEAQASLYRINSSNLLNASMKKGYLIPEIKLNAYGSLFGALVSPLYPTAAMNASLSWKIPTGKLIYKGISMRSKGILLLAENEMEFQKSKIRSEMFVAGNQLRISKTRLDKAEESRRLAETAMQHCLLRQENGTVKPFELIQAQEILAQAITAYAEAISDYNKSQYRLYVAVGNGL